MLSMKEEIKPFSPWFKCNVESELVNFEICREDMNPSRILRLSFEPTVKKGYYGEDLELFQMHLAFHV